jgi:carboxymethylenebutenolidase
VKEEGMAIQSEWLRYGGDYAGLLCRPERALGPLPAVLVLQEAWGVDGHIEDVTRRFAAAGYAAFAPDLYSRGTQRPTALSRERLAEMLAFMNTLPPTAWSDPAARETELEKRPEAERARIAESLTSLFAGLATLERHVPQVLETTRYLREDCAPTRGQKVASVGFCMGGALSGLLACHDGLLAAAVIFYGSSPRADLAAKIVCPVLGFYGGLDPRITDQVPAFAQEMAGKAFEWHVYEGARHAFFNDGRASYDPRAARDAFVRTLTLLRDVLG